MQSPFAASQNKSSEDNSFLSTLNKGMLDRPRNIQHAEASAFRPTGILYLVIIIWQIRFFQLSVLSKQSNFFRMKNCLWFSWKICNKLGFLTWLYMISNTGINNICVNKLPTLIQTPTYHTLKTLIVGSWIRLNGYTILSHLYVTNMTAESSDQLVWPQTSWSCSTDFSPAKQTKQDA